MKRLVAMFAAVVLLAAGGAAVMAAGGVRSLPAGELRSAYPSYEQVASWDFMLGEYDALRRAGARPELILGSSELRSAPAGPAHPARLFADGRYGATAVVAGRAGVNDLWQAIELGAYAPHMPEEGRRAVIFVSMQWFMCYRDPASTFPGVFSQGAYDAFMANPRIDRAVKDRVAGRVRAYGVPNADRALGPDPSSVIQAVDGAATAVASDLRLAHAMRMSPEDASQGATPLPRDVCRPANPTGSASLAGSAGSACPEGSADGAGSEGPADGASLATCAAPDFDALVEDGRARALEASRGSEFGLNRTWYQKKCASWLEGARKTWHVDDGVYFSPQEYADFQTVLDVCRQTGIEPLVVIQPVKGELYDQTIYGREVREAFYGSVRAMCERAGARVADFTTYEYDPLFLRDYSHPSAYGSALYSKAIYEFWTS